jgi:membrane protein implicated in regulation of membrane protease activity
MDEVPQGGNGFPPRFTGILQPIASVAALLVLSAFFFFAAWQVGVVAILIAVGVYVWWRGRKRRNEEGPIT